MPAAPPARSLLTAAAALVVAALSCTGPALHAVSANPSGTSASGQTAHTADTQAADRWAAAQARAVKDQVSRSRARTAAQAREAQAREAQGHAAAQARAAKALAVARSKARKAAQAKAAQAKAAQAKAAQARAAKARAVARSQARTRTATAHAVAPARTSWPALNRAIAAIPGYRDGIVRWHVTSAYGHYGHTDANQPGAANVYISPNVPAGLLYSVVAHEYGHAVVIANYGTGYGPYTEYSRDMVSWFGGDRVTGLERAADCIARHLGASWTNYTGCADTHWQKGASILLSGGRL